MSTVLHNSLQKKTKKATFMDGRKLQVGDKLDVCDQQNLWFPAVITEINENSIKVHYPEWPNDWDEIIPITDENKSRYSALHSQTFDCIHIKSQCPFTINFRSTSNTNYYSKLQFIPYYVPKNNKHYIMMYGGTSLYRFDAINHRYSIQQYVDFGGQKAIYSQYRLLDCTIKNGLYFINLHKGLCYNYQMKIKSNQWKTINVNIPCFKSYVLSNCCSSSKYNEWYIIGHEYDEIDINNINKHYDFYESHIRIHDMKENNYNNIDDKEDKEDIEDTENDENMMTEVDESGAMLRYLLNVEDQMEELQESYDRLLMYAIQQRMRAIQRELERLEMEQQRIINQEEEEQQQQEYLEDIGSLKIVKFRFDRERGFITLINKEIINNYNKSLYSYNKLLYIPSKHKLMILGDRNIKSDNIWMMDLCPMHNEYKWELYPLKLPHKKESNATDWCYHLAFNWILFVFYFMPNCHQEIWCLDLLSNKWFKSDYKYIPYCFNNEFPFTLKTTNNYLHSISVGRHKSHTKVAFIDLIPHNLYKLYFDHYYNILINKNIKKLQKKYQMEIPNDLIKLIMNYYPLFL